MIVTTLENIDKQLKFSPELEKAIAYLKALDVRDWQDGRVPIDDQRVFAIHSSYTTKTAGDEVELEGHRKYIDLQFIAAGNEAIGWAPTESIIVSTPYQADGDAWTGNARTKAINWLSLSAGWLAVLYPEDAHAPQYAAGHQESVKKVVVKVLAP
jgi:YhcH/YjgK/YiaL family protein